MVSYASVTFRSHINNKNLDEEFLTLIYPMLNKSDQFLIGIDDKDKLSQHFHICFSYNGGKSPLDKLKQKFKTKNWTNWYARVNKDTETRIDASGDSPALNLKAVKKDESDHDLMYWIGYCTKSHLKSGYKGFTDEYITTCIKYYNLNKRIKASKTTDDGWKYLKVNTSHQLIEEFVTKYKLDIEDPNLWSLMAEQKISASQLSRNQRTTIINELIVYKNKDRDDYDTNYARDCLKYNTDDPSPYGLHTAYVKKLEDLLKENNISF